MGLLEISLKNGQGRPLALGLVFCCCFKFLYFSFRMIRLLSKKVHEVENYAYEVARPILYIIQSLLNPCVSKNVGGE
jgi:hypothetical protein